jgi:hypothetical protein
MSETASPGWILLGLLSSLCVNGVWIAGSFSLQKLMQIAWAGPEFRWTVDWENLMREILNVHYKETRFWSCGRSPQGD